VVKTQPSLFVFNEDSHLEGIMHYNKPLNSIADSSDQWQLDNSALIEDEDDFEDEDDLEEDDEDEDDDEEEVFEYDFDEDEDELDTIEEDDED
jgi:hypothetical protein